MDFFDTLIHLGFGAAATILAVVAFIKRRSWGIADTVLLLPFGAALIALGLLDSMRFMDATWVHISRNVIFGGFFMLTSILALYSPPSPKFPRWTQGAMLVFGVGAIFFALAEVFFLFHS